MKTRNDDDRAKPQFTFGASKGSKVRKRNRRPIRSARLPLRMESLESRKVLSANALPIGYFDAINSGFEVAGWALDLDTPSKSIDVQIHVDGKHAATVTADKSRSDVNQAINVVGDHGFSWQISNAYLDGRQHTIAIVAVDSTSGRSIAVPGGPTSFSNHAPTGWLEGIDANNRLFGWAVDSDAPTHSIDVHVYEVTNGAYKFAGAVTTAIARPDVNQTLGVAGNHGFQWQVPDAYQDGQPHLFVAFAIDTSGGTNPTLQGSPLSFQSEQAPVLPATNVAPNGLVSIDGHATGFDRVIVRRENGLVKVEHRVDDNPPSITFWSNVEKIEFKAHQGGAYFRNDTNLTSEAFADSGPGNRGSVRFIGGSGIDIFHGGNGDDHLVGRGGDDILDGGSGDDKLSGGKGVDKLYGGNGRDVLDGGKGNDYLLDGGWKSPNGRVDLMRGGGGDDVIDLIFAGQAQIHGGAGDDTIRFVESPNGGQFINDGLGDDRVYARSHLGGPYRLVFRG